MATKALIGFGTTIGYGNITAAGTSSMTIAVQGSGAATSITASLSLVGSGNYSVSVAGNETNAGTSPIAVTGSYTVLARVQKITPHKTTVAKVDVSGFDAATLNGVPIEDQIPGWISPGEYEVTFFYQAGGSQYSTLQGLIALPLFWIVQKPDGKGYGFQAYINELGDEIAMKDGITVTCKMQINGGSVAAMIM
jgi:hypothetical protein